MARRAKIGNGDTQGSEHQPDDESGNGGSTHIGIDDTGNSGDSGTVNLASIAGSNDDPASGDSGPARRPRADRGRKRGPRKQREPEEKTSIKDFLTESIFGIHSFLSVLSGSDMLKIEMSEASMLGERLDAVLSHYDIPMMSQKTVDHVRFVQALAMVYGTRLISMRMLRKEQAPVEVKPEAPKPGNVPSAMRMPITVTPVPGMPSVNVSDMMQ